MSNVQIALCLVALLATYALAAKLDERVDSPDEVAAQPAPAGCPLPLRTRSAFDAAASAPADLARRPRAAC
jgi:hypothetical protein